MAPSFDQAYEDHVDQVYGYIAYRVGSRVDAEDLTQLTFERAYKAWSRYDPTRASVGTWLLSIARNALIDHRRRDRTAGVLSLHGDGVGEAELPRVAGPEDRGVGVGAELAAALERLRARDREIVALRFGADLKVAEIADMLDLTVANVQQILSRTLRRLRADLERARESGVTARRSP